MNRTHVSGFISTCQDCIAQFRLLTLIDISFSGDFSNKVKCLSNFRCDFFAVTDLITVIIQRYLFVFLTKFSFLKNSVNYLISPKV
jgi:hypothetical protein